MISANSFNNSLSVENIVDPSMQNTVGNPQLLAYYPKYSYLDSLLSSNDKDHINIFVDLKGCATGMYQEWCVKNIISSSKFGKHLNLDMFSSILNFIAFHKSYCAKRGIKVDLHFFMEQGRSKYHINIYDKYKANRANSDFFGLDMQSRELFFSVLDKNYSLCEKVINKIPNCSFYQLKYCEADFLPWYLMAFKLGEEDICNSINIVYSRDKDMLQCLEFPNTYQFYKAAFGDRTEYVTQKTLFKHFVKIDCEPITNDAKWFPLVLSLCGDTSDGIPGVKGLGPKLIFKNIKTIMNAYKNDPEVMYERVMRGDNLLTESAEYRKTPTLEKIFSYPDVVKRNMRLISYRALSEYVNGNFPTEAIEIRNYIDKIYGNKEKLSSYKVLWDVMDKRKLNDVVDIRVVEECFR